MCGRIAPDPFKYAYRERRQPVVTKPVGHRLNGGLTVPSNRVTQLDPRERVSLAGARKQPVKGYRAQRSATDVRSTSSDTSSLNDDGYVAASIHN